MIILSKQGDGKPAYVYVGKLDRPNGELIEFVDAIQNGVARQDKWVVIVSTQIGCPIKCLMCDAGGDYKGDLSADEILAQIDYIVSTHKEIDIKKIKKFKIQFARMGEPALNTNVLKVLDILPEKYPTKGLIPCIATTAPAISRQWFESLADIRHRIYRDHEFQLQFSINTTDDLDRDRLIPIPKMSFYEINGIASKFYKKDKRKVSLNFAMTKCSSIDPKVISKYFNPDTTCIKITPVNPTYTSNENNIESAIDGSSREAIRLLCDTLMTSGFDVIVSIGDERENKIGSNCGMAVRAVNSEQ